MRAESLIRLRERKKQKEDEDDNNFFIKKWTQVIKEW